MKNIFIVIITVIGLILFGVNSVYAATSLIDTWDDGTLQNWSPNTTKTTIQVINSGGNPDGFLHSYISQNVANYIVGAVNFDDDHTGNFIGNDLNNIKVDLKFIVGSFSSCHLRLRSKDDKHNGWKYPLTTSFPSKWTTYSVSFDPYWTDSEAIANGWEQEQKSLSFSETIFDAFSTEIRVIGDGEVGIDNFAIGSTSAYSCVFKGTWVNDGDNATGITKIVIDQNGTDITAHTYGKCHPTDCDWGKVSVNCNGNSITAVYDFGFKISSLTLQLLDSNSLYVHDSSVFYDGTNRDYEVDYYFYQYAKTVLQSITLTAPTDIETLFPGDKVTIQWTTENVDASESITISMKRDSVSESEIVPDNKNWYRFTDNGVDPTNDCFETIQIPYGIIDADDWRFYVGSETTGLFDSSSTFKQVSKIADGVTYYKALPISAILPLGVTHGDVILFDAELSNKIREAVLTNQYAITTIILAYGVILSDVIDPLLKEVFLYANGNYVSLEVGLDNFFNNIADDMLASEVADLFLDQISDEIKKKYKVELLTGIIEPLIDYFLSQEIIDDLLATKGQMAFILGNHNNDKSIYYNGWIYVTDTSKYPLAEPLTYFDFLDEEITNPCGCTLQKGIITLNGWKETPNCYGIFGTSDCPDECNKTDSFVCPNEDDPGIACPIITGGVEPSSGSPDTF